MVEVVISLEIKEDPQDLFEDTTDDSPSLLGEAQEDIQPQNQPSQEKENLCSSIQRKRKIPRMDWSRNLPVFQDEKFDDPLLHLIKFHIHVWRLKVEWHEDCLMKIFMGTLEGKATKWYESLKPGSLFSLKNIHKVFYEHYK